PGRHRAAHPCEKGPPVHAAHLFTIMSLERDSPDVIPGLARGSTSSFVDGRIKSGHNEEELRSYARLAGGSTGTVPISPGTDTSRISRSSEVRNSLWWSPPGI